MTKSIGINKISLKRVFAFSLTLALTFGFTTNLGVLSSSAANRNSEKVTICHRTSAVTNPYRMITVSVNSVVGNNGHHNNVHNHETNGADPVTTGPGVFNPAGQPNGVYAPNAKKWEDIIPAFFYNVTQGQTVTRTYFPGRNWTTDGRAIYYGLGDKAGLCNDSGAREFALDEYNTWLTDYPLLNNGAQPNDGQINSQKRAIINDLKDQGNIKDGNLSSLDTNFDELPAEPKKPKGPNRPPAYDALIQSIVTQNSNVDPVANPTTATLKQALAGVVWKDMNNNGIQDAGEDVFGNLPIQIIDPATNLPLTLEQISLMSQMSTSVPRSQPLFSFAGLAKDRTVFSTASNVATLTTDANGYFQIPSLPEGDWQVNVITPDGWSYTYDSAGSSDGQMPGTYVPAGGAGFAWAGLVFVGTTPATTTPGTTSGTTPGTTSGTTPSKTSGTAAKTSGLATTGNDLAWMNDAIVALVAIGGAFVLMGRGRREEQVEELGTKD